MPTPSLGINFADSDVPVSTIVVTLVILAVSIVWYILRGLNGNETSQEEKRHWDEERGRKRVIIQDSFRSVREGKANPVRIWEALYDVDEGSFVTSPPLSLGQDLPNMPASWFAELTQALGDYSAGYLKHAAETFEVADAEVQRRLSTDGDLKVLDAKRDHRRACLEQLRTVVRSSERCAKAYRMDGPIAQLPQSFQEALRPAQDVLEKQDKIQRGLTWQIGRLIIDAEMACWLAVGICLKVLMGAPAPLQVLALTDAAKAMAQGGDEGYQEFITAISNCFFFFCIEKLLQFLARITMIRGEFLFTAKLQRQLYSKMLQQDYEFFDGKPTANLQNIVYDSTEKVCGTLIFMRVRIIQALATVFFQVVLIAWRFPRLALVVNSSLPVAIALRYYSKDYIERAGSRLKARGNFVGQRTWDVLSNLPTVRSHCREAGAVEDYTRCMAYQARLVTKLNVFGGLAQPFLHFCDTICVYIGYYYGGSLIRMGSITTAELMTVIHQFQTVSQELNHMLDTITGSIMVTEHGRDVLDILLSRPKIEPPLFVSPSAGRELGKRANGDLSKLSNTEVEFRDVVFSYPGSLLRTDQEDVRILKGLSFVAKDGEFTAIVGKTGGGKSTVTLLMQRLYDVCKGSVLIGGVDVREQDVKRLRRSLAVVSQEPVLFSTSIYENLLYALEDHKSELSASEKEEQMIDACRKADAWDFVESFQDRLGTDVGPRGSQLSGGQKQRLTIARAILKNAPLLILDEATSSLDVEAEQSVQKALDQLIGDLSGGRPVTRLVVAHRLSTIRRADNILVIEGGNIREQGKHEELAVKEGGLYARFLRLSLGEDPDAPAAGTPKVNGVKSPSATLNCNAKPRVSAVPIAVKEVDESDSCCGKSASALQEAYVDFRERFAALKAELQDGSNGSDALMKEVERCQHRLGALIEGSSGCQGA